MPSSTLIDFSDLGSAATIPIPSNYQNFHWLGYDLQEEFTGIPLANLDSVFTTPPARVIHGAGFQMTADTPFDLNDLSIAPHSGLGQLDITIKASRTTNVGLEVVASFVIRTSPQSSPDTAVISNLTVKNISQLQIFSNSMETFDVGRISITRS